jgi:hypothetical protein
MVFIVSEYYSGGEILKRIKDLRSGEYNVEKGTAEIM